MGNVLQLFNQLDNTAEAQRKLIAEAAEIEAWYGANLYSSFLRKHQCRPDDQQAATLGKLMGTKVKSSSNKMLP